MTPEFSRTYRLDSLGIDRAIEIEAHAEERAALAQRFGLLSLENLSAQAKLSPGTQGIEAQGTLHARGEQACVVTGDPVPVALDEAFAIRFVAADTPDNVEEIEIAADDWDIVEHDGNMIDLGEAVAETLGLALPPYPRGPHAEDRLKAAGVLSEEEAGPFGVLAALRDKLGGAQG
jgi:uncharacterized metal-binding protein YceD (DUF177 family)